MACAQTGSGKTVRTLFFILGYKWLPLWCPLQYVFYLEEIIWLTLHYPLLHWIMIWNCSAFFILGSFFVACIDGYSSWQPIGRYFWRMYSSSNSCGTYTRTGDSNRQRMPKIFSWDCDTVVFGVWWGVRRLPSWKPEKRSPCNCWNTRTTSSVYKWRQSKKKIFFYIESKLLLLCEDITSIHSEQLFAQKLPVETEFESRHSASDEVFVTGMEQYLHQ